MTTNRRRVIIWRARLLVAGLLLCANTEVAVSANVNSLNLSVKIDLYQSRTQKDLSISIRNPASRAACVSSRAFSSIDNYVDIWNHANIKVPRRREGAPIVKVFRGFDFADPYYILLPGKTLEVDMSLDDFVLSPGNSDIGSSCRITCAGRLLVWSGHRKLATSKQTPSLRLDISQFRLIRNDDAEADIRLVRTVLRT